MRRIDPRAIALTQNSSNMLLVLKMIG